MEMSWLEIALRLGSAAIAGAAIGIEREIQHKAAGFRTIAIVCIGAAVATLASVTATADPAAASRVLQGVLAGIGFLGAGVIVHQAQTQHVKGLTTAASIWTAAAIGSVCGLGLWKIVLVSTGLVLILLVAARYIERAFNRRESS
jgi:putative Mg2+ transporter-C (MgtC) family protein